MPILQLADTPLYTVGASFQIPRRTLAKSSETVQATVARVRKGASEYIYTLSIDDGMKYAHWRVATEGMLRQAVNEAARHVVAAAA